MGHEAYIDTMTDNQVLPAIRTRTGDALAYSAVVVVVFLLLYLFPLVLLRLPGFESWETSELAVDMDYIVATPHIDADIVVVGESSALYGVDPRQISSSLGLKTLNLGNTLATLPVTGQLELDRYLRQNKRPRLLVFYLVPWDLDFNRSTLGRYEGEEMLFRYGSAGDILRYSQGHASEMLTFPFQFYAANTLFSPSRRRRPSATNRSIIEQSGHSPLGPYSPLSDSCAFPEHIVQEIGKTSSIETLLQAYRSSADRVVLYMAPVPRCKGYKTMLEGPYAQLGAMPPQVLPARDFGDDTYFAHPMATSVSLVTQQLAHALQASLTAAARDRSAP